ncbi:TolB family protein, partial [Chloroflexota bacterium]
GRDDPAEEESTLFVYNLKDGQRTNLFSHERLRGTRISPGGRWIAYFLTFSDEPGDNGVWVVNSEGTERHKLDVPGFGAYRWRDDDSLLYIPMRPSAEESMQLWAVDAATGQSRPLTDPASLPFSVANGDWEISPDGRQVIFVNSIDHNIWLMTLP